MPFFVFTWSVCTSISASTPCHTNTHTHRRDCQRLWLAQNTTHTGVITMQVDYTTISNYCVNFFILWGFFIFFSRWQTLLVGLKESYGLSDSQANSCELQMHPLVFVWRSWHVSKSSFLHVSVKCKERGDVNVSGWVWVCVVCDIVKRVWERIKTQDLPPQVFNQTPNSLKQVHPERDLHSAGALHKVSNSNSLNFYWDSLQYCFTITFFFSS